MGASSASRSASPGASLGAIPDAGLVRASADEPVQSSGSDRAGLQRARPRQHAAGHAGCGKQAPARALRPAAPGSGSDCAGLQSLTRSAAERRAMPRSAAPRRTGPQWRLSFTGRTAAGVSRRARSLSGQRLPQRLSPSSSDDFRIVSKSSFHSEPPSRGATSIFSRRAAGRLERRRRSSTEGLSFFSSGAAGRLDDISFSSSRPSRRLPLCGHGLFCLRLFSLC